MKKLPIGIQDLRKLRAEDFIYIDKTPQIYELIKDGGYYFLSRPRRFGKSLLVSTIAELFKGNKALFNDLWISNHWDWNKTNPTIEFRFNNAAYREVGLKQYLSDRIKEQAKRYAISLSTKSYPDQLKELIETLAEQYGQVVFLVDEYDKPIIDYLDDVPKAEEHRDILKIFYSVLKPLDIHLRFVFLTGVSKFSRMSIFSELNNLNDITMHPKYATMLGYTQKELLAYFAEHITKITTKYESREALLDQIQLWYNGYTWDGKNKVYNPFSTLSFFDSGVFRSFWFETGTPTFLIKLLQDRHMINLEEMETDATTLESFDLHKISTETLLFQTGYITIKKINPFGL
ncbi:MAG: AAA family ATPase, partial [Flammeovirgaceae bacterium]